MIDEADAASLLENSSDIVRSYVSRNSVAPAELIKLIADVHKALSSLGVSSEQPVAAHALTPVVPIKKSITPDYLICLDDGKQFKSMKRHIGKLGMTPDQYRVKWNLPADYPMVAPNYAAIRSTLAKKNGLGRKAEERPRRRAKAKT